MKNVIEEKPISTGTAYGIFFVFFVIGVVSVFVPIYFFIDMFMQISTKQDQITLDKGIYFLFGGGAFFVLAGLGIFVTRLFKVSEKIEKFIVTLMIISIFLIFALPQIVHFSVANYLEEEGYQVCPEKSHRWLFVVTIVYTKSLPCNEE